MVNNNSTSMVNIRKSLVASTKMGKEWSAILCMGKNMVLSIFQIDAVRIFGFSYEVFFTMYK